MVREIPLTKGYVALVDDEDFGKVSHLTWFARSGGNTVYAMARVQRKRKFIHFLLHRLVMDAPEGVLVDHKDGNGLDCTRENLRFASAHESMCNRGKFKSNTSGYKGVSYRSDVGRWRAQIYANREKVHLGNFVSAIEAAYAYDSAARRLHGAFARVNFPLEGERAA